MDVFNTVENLLGVISGYRLGKRARVCDVIKELSTRYHFLGNVGNLDLTAILFYQRGVILKIEVFDNMLVVKIVYHFHLFLEVLNEVYGLRNLFISFEDFYGKFSTIRRDT